MDDGQSLEEKNYAYDRLRELWIDTRAVIATTHPYLNLEHYQIDEENSDETCLRFWLLGAECYVAFVHDTERGALEYGVIDPLSERGRRIRVTEVTFDQRGCDGGRVVLGDKRTVRNLHKLTITQHAGALVQTYFAAWRGEVEVQGTR